MPKAKLLVMRVSIAFEREDALNLRTVEDATNLLAAQLKRECGGTAIGLRDGRAFRIEAHLSDPTILRSLLDALVESFKRHGDTATVTVLDDVAVPLSPAAVAMGEDLRVRHERLTKKLLISLTEGKFVASNVWEGGVPVFAEHVSPVQEREEQWRRVVAANADQELCEIYPNETAFRQRSAAVARRDSTGRT
jgi:hypothetical protein